VQCFRFPDEIVMHLLYAEATSSEMEPVEHGWSEDGNESYCDIELVVALGFRLDHSKDLKVLVTSIGWAFTGMSSSAVLSF
jgi:hypothetical protein